jgi:hypothetical protein
MRNMLHEQNSVSVLHYSEVERIWAEHDIEVRLRDLGKMIDDLMDAPYPGLLRERVRIREALEELTVKETTLRWIIRVARSAEGAVQRRLWSDIDKALTDLEKIAESMAEPESSALRH